MRALKPKIGTDLEYSRFAAVRELPQGGAVFELTPTTEEIAALCKRLDLQSLDVFDAKVSLNALPGNQLWALKGQVTAKFVQSCVISLLPVPCELTFDFEELYTNRPPKIHSPKDNIENDDGPEILEDGGIDIGEVLTQYLSLNLPEFPRASGVSLAQFWDNDEKDIDIN